MDEQIASWRLLELIRSYNIKQEPLDLDDVSKLGAIATGPADLHVACRALREGCGIDTAVKLFS